MKYFVLLGDGMADVPVKDLKNKTPLEYASTPYMNTLAQLGHVGLVKTIPDGCSADSDVGNLTVLGYHPKKYLTGRSPLEAAAMGIEMAETDAALRANLVCLSEDEPYEEKRMIDYSADEISTQEARQLIAALNEKLKTSEYELHPGVSYRHCLIIHNCGTNMTLAKPHNITNELIKDHLPKGEKSDLLLNLMKQSHEILKNHPVNIARKERGLKPANSLWLWGQGSKPNLPSFKEKYGLNAAMITAVDLLRGIARCADMRIMEVEGATGNLHTNFKGKAQAAIQAFDEGCDLVYLHVEAPDECGHRNEIMGKVQAIEKLDSEVLKPVWIYLRSQREPYAIMVLPDHPTPVERRVHTPDPVPFVIYSSLKQGSAPAEAYTEECARGTGIFIEYGDHLMGMFINNSK